MIVITGAAGFIGSCLISKLNHNRHENLILVDDFRNYKINNYHTKILLKKLNVHIFGLV